MKLLNFAAAAATVACLASASHATTISITTFDINDFTAQTSGPLTTATIEDFEVTGPKEGAGILPGPLTTSVGTFDTLGDVGTGSTCDLSRSLAGLGAGDCTELALFDQTTNGQGNLVPTTGDWSLNSNDTLGIKWTAGIGGGEFNRLVFAMMDAGDQGASVTVSAFGESESVNFDLSNANEKLVVINFLGMPVTSATVDIRSSKVNDAIAIDGASVVNVVPLPAAGWMLLAGLGGLVAMKRRKREAA